MPGIPSVTDFFSTPTTVECATSCKAYGDALHQALKGALGSMIDAVGMIQWVIPKNKTSIVSIDQLGNVSVGST